MRGLLILLGLLLAICCEAQLIQTDAAGNTVRIDGWGRDSLRVRIGMHSLLYVNIKWSLDRKKTTQKRSPFCSNKLNLPSGPTIRSDLPGAIIEPGPKGLSFLLSPPVSHFTLSLLSGQQTAATITKRGH